MGGVLNVCRGTAGLLYSLCLLKRRGVETNMVDYDIVESGFELQSCYYVDFETNTLR